MKKLVDKNDISKIKLGSYIGKGKEGFCYLSQDKSQVTKLFYGINKDKKIYFDNIVNSQIAFPKEILYDKESQKMIGYTMPYLNGDRLLDGFDSSMQLRDLKNAYLQIRLIILKLKDVYMDDLCLENMLYDNNSKLINIIDTSRWYQEYDGQFESIKILNWQLMCALLLTIRAEYTRLKQNKRLNELLKMYENDEKDISMFINFLNELELDVSEYQGKKIKQISELKY